ncbi:tRNA glutamyl-Q(34) synthetase GluQRS [Sphingobium fontiphilum]|nr:tRNA glutamyl-Q(34) synthetase GluQRS [Sphingobium fontiphilum]
MPPDPLQHMVTRFAPSPTGRLHIGHGWSALMAMDMARAAGGAFRLRIEDIDGARSRPEHVAGIVEDLRWLGVAWDGAMMAQSERLAHYESALDRLRAMGLLYPCFCTRADIQAQWAASASAPHGSEGPVYPGACRGMPAAERAEKLAALPHAWRLDMAAAIAMAGPLDWRDAPFPYEGGGGRALAADPGTAGDVVLARKDAPASYHLSCTLDDAAMGVTHVLRGADLRSATPVHRLLQALLDLPSPLYIHHPLLIGPDGKRLAKRAGSIALAELRAAGVAADALAADLRAARFPVGISLGQA